MRTRPIAHREKMKVVFSLFFHCVILLRTAIFISSTYDVYNHPHDQDCSTMILKKWIRRLIYLAVFLLFAVWHFRVTTTTETGQYEFDIRLEPTESTEDFTTTEPWRFVSIPDLLNNDVDFQDHRWEGDIGESGDYGALRFVMDNLQDENPDFVAIAGDLVMGRWSLDSMVHHFFVRGSSRRRSHISYMADRFYGATVERFKSYGLKLLTVIGDHEMGDGGWTKNDMDKKFISEYRDAYVKHFDNPKNGPPGYAGRSYYIRYKNLLFVAVDVFQSPNLNIELSPVQEAWLRAVLTMNSDLPHKIAMAHVPILPPSHVRSSSGMTFPHHEESNFWRVMEEYEVDLYIAGEVHDISIQEQSKVLQVVHGTQMSNVRDVNYMVVDVFPDRLELTLKKCETTLKGSRNWLLDPYFVDPYPKRIVKVTPEQQSKGFYPVGTLTIDKSSRDRLFLDKTGVFVERFTSFPLSHPSRNLFHLIVHDESNAKDWDLKGDLQLNTFRYGDRPGCRFKYLPDYLIGSDWIRAANDSKEHRCDVLVEFDVAAASRLYVAWDSRQRTPPWLKSWAITDDQITHTGSEPFDLYYMDVSPGTVSLGDNNDADAMYSVFIVPTIQSIQSLSSLPYLAEKQQVVP